jgi:hypothetical protein
VEPKKKKISHSHHVNHSAQTSNEERDTTLKTIAKKTSAKKSHVSSHPVATTESNLATHTLENGEGTMNKEATTESTPAPTSTPSATAPAPIDFPSILASLEAISGALGTESTPLTIADRRRLVKMRPGGLAHVESVMSAAARYGLVLPGVDNASVEADLALLSKLGPVTERIGALDGLAGDVRAKAEGRVWKATTDAYSLLTRCITQYPSLQRELAPIASFLAIKFKDAPTSLRPQEKKALTKARGKRKAKTGQDAAASVATTTTPAVNAEAPQVAAASAPKVTEAASVPVSAPVATPPVISASVTTSATPPVTVSVAAPSAPVTPAAPVVTSPAATAS